MQTLKRPSRKEFNRLEGTRGYTRLLGITVESFYRLYDLGIAYIDLNIDNDPNKPNNKIKVSFNRLAAFRYKGLTCVNCSTNG